MPPSAVSFLHRVQVDFIRFCMDLRQKRYPSSNQSDRLAILEEPSVVSESSDLLAAANKAAQQVGEIFRPVKPTARTATD